jgi:hypothetical protein
MQKLLRRLLDKKKIDSVDDLSSEERADFERWDKTLSEGEMSVEKIAEFCRNQINSCEMMWSNLDNSPEKNQKLILMHTIYKKMLGVIESPEAEREALEKYLTQLIDSKQE